MPIQFSAPAINDLSPLGNAAMGGIGLGNALTQSQQMVQNEKAQAMKNNTYQQEMANQIAAANAHNQSIATNAAAMGKANTAYAQARTPYINSQTGVNNSSIPVNQAKAYALTHPQPTGSTADLTHAINIYNSLPASDPRKQMYANHIAKLNAISKGLSMNQDAGGQWHISEGGLQPVHSQPMGGAVPQGSQVGSNVPQGVGLGNRNVKYNGSELLTTPTSPHSRFSTGGSTVYDPATGNFASTPTKKVVSALQNTALGESVAPSGLFMATKDILPYVGLSPAKAPQAVDKLWGNESPAYDKYTAAIQTGIPHMADQMLSILGLNKTNELYKNMLVTLKPSWNDTRGSYSRKIATSLAEGLIRQKKYNQIMKFGIPLNSNNPNEIEGNSVKRGQLIDHLQNMILNNGATSTPSTPSTNPLDDALKARGPTK